MEAKGMTAAVFENLPTIVTTVSTVFIGVFTAVLALATKRQGKIMRAVEGPVPIIGEIKLVEYTDPSSEAAVADRVLPGPLPKFCRVLPAICNLGRTPARFTRFCIECVVSPTLPDEPSYNSNRCKDWSLSFPPTGSIWFRIDPIGDINLTDDERQRVQMGRDTFWVYGRVSYTDLFDEAYDLGFIARWDLKLGLSLETRQKYTYTRKTPAEARQRA